MTDINPTTSDDHASKKPALPEFADEFLSKALKSPRTRENYHWALVALQRFANETRYHRTPRAASMPARVIKDDVLVEFLDWLIAQKHYSAATMALYLAAAKRYLGWLYARGKLDPSFRLDAARQKLSEETRGGVLRYAPRRPDPNLASILSFYDGQRLPSGKTAAERQSRLVLLRNRAVVHTLYSSAGRASEVTQLNCQTVDQGYGTAVEVTGKGGKRRMLILTQEAQQAIRQYLAERERQGEHVAARPGKKGVPLFVSHGRGRLQRLSRTTLWRVVSEAARTLGLKSGSGPHAFRHFRAQSLRDEGMDLGMLQALLGHASIETTRRIYAPQTDVRQLVDALATYGVSAGEAAQRAGRIVPAATRIPHPVRRGRKPRAAGDE
jgi:site-specific recombinase XerD